MEPTLFLIWILISCVQASRILQIMPTVNFPIRFAYINRITDWSNPQGLAKSMGVPGYSNHSYNYICFTFWTCGTGNTDTAILWNNPTNYFGTYSSFGTTDTEIRTNLKKKYANAGIKIMVSAFGSTENPTSQKYDAITCADNLASYVTKNQLDGVDIDWEDTAAFQTASGGGEAWLIKFTTQLRSKLPNAIITHSPQAPYFGGKTLYPNNAYLAVDKAVGSTIQFYNVQFYNQGSTSYNTSNSLFNVSGGWARGTSVNEIIAKGIPKEKIVVGKPATPTDTYSPSSYMSPRDLNAAFVAAYKYNQFKTGCMFWQFASDPNGSIVSQAMSGLLTLLNSSNISNSDTNPTVTTNVVKFGRVSKVMSQPSPSQFLLSLGFPINGAFYNVISYSAWTFSYGAVQAAQLVTSLCYSIGQTFCGSNTNNEQKLQQLMNTYNNVRYCMQVFGPYENPTTQKIDAVVAAKNLIQFLQKYSFQCIEIEYNDSVAFSKGTGQRWLVSFIKTLKASLPKLCIYLTANAGYFTSSPTYKYGAMLNVSQKIDSLIDLYNIEYYNQGSSSYNTFQTLFNVSSGWALKTAVNELIKKGISAQKIIVGKEAKPVKDSFAFMNAPTLQNAIALQYQNVGWKTGVMIDDIADDLNGNFIQTVTKPLTA